MPDANDEALIREAQQGHVRAFEVLLDRYEGRVLRTLRLMGIRPQEREDAAQEVFLRVFRHLGGFRRGRPFAAWLYRVTVNVAHDHRNRQRRRTPEAEPARGFESTPDPGPDPAERAGQEELRRNLERALEDLTDRERAVFVLREIEGLSTGEVAASLRITGVTVRRHLGRARRRLRAMLEDEKVVRPEEKLPSPLNAPPRRGVVTR